MHVMQICISIRTIVVPQDFISALFVLPPRYGLPARPNEQQGKKGCGTDWQHLAYFRDVGAIGADSLRYHNLSVRYPNLSLIETTCT